MSAHVLHDTATGQARSICTTVGVIPAGMTDKQITDAEFQGLTAGTHLWDVATRTVKADTVKTQAAANLATLQSRAQAALATNATFMAIASPTTAQVAAQVKTLTKECNAIIRLALGLLDDITDTA